MYGQGREALIAANGLAKLTYRAVAAEAGVTHGTAQHHFANLDELVEAALAYCVEISLAGSALASESDSIDDWGSTIGPSVRAARDEQVLFELVLESQAPTRTAAGRRPIRRELSGGNPTGVTGPRVTA